jgi:hypothetical protein
MLAALAGAERKRSSGPVGKIRGIVLMKFDCGALPYNEFRHLFHHFSASNLELRHPEIWSRD